MNEHQKQIDSGSSSDVKKNGSRKKFFILLSACILLCAAVILILSQQKKAGVSETRTLRVSLYPIVPDKNWSWSTGIVMMRISRMIWMCSFLTAYI